MRRYLNGSSLTPLMMPPWVHEYHKLLAKTAGKHLAIRRFVSRVPVSQNNWSIWMRDSASLRETLADYLTRTGIVDRDKLAAYLSAVSRGDVNAGGKLFHLAAIARWMTLGSRGHS